MNESLRSTIIFSLGAAAGSVVTYLITKNILDQQKEEEIESVKEIYRKAAEDLKTSKQKEIDDLEEARKEAFDMNKTYKRILKDNGYNILVRKEGEGEELDPEKWKPYVVGENNRKEPKVAKVIRMATKEEDEAHGIEHTDDTDPEDQRIEREIQEMSESLANRPRDNDPYIIDLDQFNDERPEYDKLTVTYYSGDVTLVDDKEEMMDISSTVGHEVLDILSEQTPCIYVRNDNLAIDYEVIWVEAGYAEVNGYEE